MQDEQEEPEEQQQRVTRVDLGDDDGGDGDDGLYNLRERVRPTIAPDLAAQTVMMSPLDVLLEEAGPRRSR